MISTARSERRFPSSIRLRGLAGPRGVKPDGERCAKCRETNGTNRLDGPQRDESPGIPHPSGLVTIHGRGTLSPQVPFSVFLIII